MCHESASCCTNMSCASTEVYSSVFKVCPFTFIFYPSILGDRGKAYALADQFLFRNLREPGFTILLFAFGGLKLLHAVLSGFLFHLFGALMCTQEKMHIAGCIFNSHFVEFVFKFSALRPIVRQVCAVMHVLFFFLSLFTLAVFLSYCF